MSTNEQDIPREKISNILGIPNSTSDWTIIDSVPGKNLYKIHFTETASPQFQKFRGTTVDVQKGIVVCDGFGVIPTEVTYSLDKIENLEKMEMKRGYDGALVMVWYRDGVVWHSTNSKIDFSRSRWGNSDTFRDMWEELGGPEDHELFDILDYEDSSLVYYFLLAHEQLIFAEKTQKESKLLYLGCGSFSPTPDTDNLPADMEEYETPETFETREEAESWLASGDKPSAVHHLYRPGGFIVLYKDGLPVLRVEGISYNRRSLVRGNNPNIRHRVYELIDVLRPENQDQYEAFFPLPPVGHKEINFEQELRIIDERLYDEYQLLKKNREKLITWYIYLYRIKCDTSHMSPRLRTLISDAAMSASAKHIPLGKVIRTYVFREYGPSLYRLVKEMEEYMKN